RGRTCATSLQTRVQTRTLPLRRVRKALRIIGLLSEKIAAAQVDIATATTGPEIVRSTPPPLLSPSKSTAAPLSRETISPGKIWIHFVAFVILISTGIVAILEA